MKAEVSLYLDTRRALKNGLYPLKLHVYFPPKNARLFSLSVSLSKADFENSYLAAKPKKEYKDLKLELVATLQKATEIAKDLGDLVTFEKFERKMFRSKSSNNNVIEHFAARIKELEDNEQIGTASGYDCTINSILSFLNEGKRNNITFLSFSSLTPEVLNRYEKWMMGHDKSKTTVGIYLRNLRAIFNRAIKEGDIDPKLYPFHEYKIPNGKNIKKALESGSLKKLFTAEVEPGSHFEKARDFWFFSYQCNGMNFRDIAELKFKNMNDTYFAFLRHKTKNTTKENPSPIMVPLTDPLIAFIKKYGNKRGKPNDYVFPIFNHEMSAKERHRINQNFIRYVNQHMQRLSDKLNLGINIGTMVARHSFTTKVTRTMGLEFAQEALGHTTMSTTQNYWKGFEDATKKEMADKLMDFTKEPEEKQFKFLTFPGF